MSIVVLDPGHGGGGRGGSSGAGVLGQGGAVEKELTLDVARRAAPLLRAAGHRVVLTRDDDRAVALAERAAVARDCRADQLISLHFAGDPDPALQGTSAWVHSGAGSAAGAPHSSIDLATALAATVSIATGHRVAPIGRAPLAVLDPRALDAPRDRGAPPIAPPIAAAHLELSYLSDPREAARLGTAAYRERLAEAIAAAVARAAPRPALGDGAVITRHRHSQRQLDIWHEVPLVPQVTGMSCWAAGAAMLIGWRDAISVAPEQVARAAGRWQEYRDGLEPSDVESFAATWGLRAQRLGALSAARLRELLIAHGPLWVGEASPGLHVVVIAGMIGDGSDDGTELRVVDPWPVGRGERYRLSVRALAQSHAAASRLAGSQALVLHTEGRGRGARRLHDERVAYESTIENTIENTIKNTIERTAAPR